MCGEMEGTESGRKKGGVEKKETSRKPGDFQKLGFNLFRNSGDLAKLRCAPGILEAQPAFNTGAFAPARDLCPCRECEGLQPISLPWQG